MSEALTKKYEALAVEGGPLHGVFTVRSVTQVNFKVDGLKGHPFCIGSAHVAHASDHCGGILGPETLERIGCEHTDYTGGRKCRRPYHAHTSDTVLFLSLVRDCTNAEAAKALFPLKEQLVADGIDGVAFVESGFRIV